ncbi:alpha-ketoglutarate-dependent dioxygenase alkB homolog 6-like [Liolophura sinensis]|uniref:alpha-ketoglutarate-dependent dioxygenase alkB homolog 6-like n=1 Tax=Liolophura sinensis TaxID=3198878 RepID=UPI0031593381
MTTATCAQTSVDKFLVEKAPPTIFYIPDFITKEEEQHLLNNVYSAPKPKWTQLSNRRLQNWGGLPHAKGMVPENLPQWLSVYAQKIASLRVFDDKVPNHVLVNEYKPGQGIMPHQDGDLFYPTVSTITLGSHTLLDFYHHINSTDQRSSGSASLAERHFLSLLLQPRSLVLVKDDMYKVHLHGISERVTDEVTDLIANLDSCKDAHTGDRLTRETRVSLTIRFVPKVLKTKFLFGKSKR